MSSNKSLASSLIKKNKVQTIKKSVEGLIDQYETYANEELLEKSIYKVGEHYLITDNISNLIQYLTTYLPLKDIKYYKIAEPAYISSFKDTNNKIIVCCEVLLFAKQMVGKAREFGLSIKRIS